MSDNWYFNTAWQNYMDNTDTFNTVLTVHSRIYASLDFDEL